MADLSNLFNSPPAPPPRRSLPPDSPPTPIAGPSRGNNPLFLSPGSAVDSPRRGAPQERRARSPTFDAAADRPSRAADAGFFDRDFSSRPAPSAAQREFSLPPDDADDILDPFAGLRNGDDDAEGAPKKRRVVAKVDGERLTGEDGILKLMKAAKKFKVKGKGREADDLKDLLNVYQLWAHGMFPKGDFMGTMTRVEAVCRTRRMESAIKGYRDAFYPRPSTPTPPPRVSPSRSRSRSPTTRARSKSKSASREPSPDATTSFFDASAPSAQPLFSARDDQEMEDDDGPDLDELLAMEEMENAESSGPTPAATATAGGANGSAGQDIPDEEDEFEGLYD